MKTIHLLRHAKSCWDNPGLSDIDRPLNARGRKACHVMAPALLEAGFYFDTVYCSQAQRAQQTIEGIATALPEQPFEWQIDIALYTFDYRILQSWLQRLPNHLTAVSIIGHNPAILDFCNILAGQELTNVPTCAYTQLQMHSNNWRDTGHAALDMTAFITPKMLLA